MIVQWGEKEAVRDSEKRSWEQEERWKGSRKGREDRKKATDTLEGAGGALPAHHLQPITELAMGKMAPRVPGSIAARWRLLPRFHSGKMVSPAPGSMGASYPALFLTTPLCFLGSLFSSSSGYSLKLRPWFLPLHFPCERISWILHLITMKPLPATWDVAHDASLPFTVASRHKALLCCSIPTFPDS